MEDVYAAPSDDIHWLESSHRPLEAQHQVTYPHDPVLVALPACVPRWPDVRRHRDRRRSPLAPYVAILCYSTIAIVLALTGSFAELVALSTLSIAALYIAGCAASWALARRGVALSGTPLNFRFLGAATAIGISSMLALIALGSRQEIIGLATLIGLSILLYLIQARIALPKPD